VEDKAVISPGEVDIELVFDYNNNITVRSFGDPSNVSGSGSL
tara:strand:- start:1502 stop:1627 length:126 start_codon:yes stop_codon:yes gene_type:complete